MTSPSQRRQLFISYSHADRVWVVRLQKMIQPLVRDKDLKLWDDSQIPAGARWKEEIQQALATAKVALLLVSADFLASDFVNSAELPHILKAAEEEGMRILWVKLRSCLVQHTPIHEFQAAIDPARPLAAMVDWEQEEALAKVAETIDVVLQQAREEEFQRQEAERLAREEEESKRRKAEHEQKLKRYEQAFTQAIDTHYPLDKDGAERFQQLQRELALSNDDVAQTEAPLIASKQEEYQRKQAQERERQNAERRAPDRAASTSAPPISPSPWPLHPIRATNCLLLREGNRWRQQRTPVEVEGYEEELAPGVALTMVRIPSGTFLMGSPEGEEGRDDREGPQHEVSVREFFLGQTPITQAQWRAVALWQPRDGEQWGRDLKSDPSRFQGKEARLLEGESTTDNRPVEQVKWHDAQEFCRRLSQRTGRRYGLPSEAQWEYACRAGTTTPFHFGDTLTAELANYNAIEPYGRGPKGSYREQTTDVGTFPANPWGLYDMHGNVWEWCEDHRHASYDFAPGDDQPWLIPAAGPEELRLLRGGAWNYLPSYCRSATRWWILPVDSFPDDGIRVCCLPPGPSC